MKNYGYTILEIIFVLALLSTLAVLTLPSLLKLYYQADLDLLAVNLISEMKSVKYNAISKNNAFGIVLYSIDRKWYYIVVQDGNNNGIRISDIENGIDTLVKNPAECSSESRSASIGIPHHHVPKIPPDTGTLDPNNPVQFGESNIFACSPSGTCTSGTLYLMSNYTPSMRAIRIFGPIAKFTLWHYSEEWRVKAGK